MAGTAATLDNDGAVTVTVATSGDNAATLNNDGANGIEVD